MSETKGGTQKSRNRAPNFSKKEQELLVRCLDPYKHIIECKKTDHIKNTQKQDAWKKVGLIFNANTTHVARTGDNLLACYRNLKSRIKKERSMSKMGLKGTSEKVAHLQSDEDQGNDREAETCKFNQYKQAILGTGGGSPPNDDQDDPLIGLKKLIEPQQEGLYTSYDGDAGIMKEYTATLPKHEQILPIEYHCIEGEVIQTAENLNNETCANDIKCTSPAVKPFTSRVHKKRKSDAFNHDDETPKHKKVNESLQTLAGEKLELVKLQKKALEMDIQHKNKTHALELDNLIKQNNHNEIMRQKELLLMELKIKNLSE